MNALFDHGKWLEQYTDVLQTLWHFDDELGIVYVIFGQKTVAQIDAALEVGVISSHVICTDEVINALAGTANRGDHIITRLQFGHIRADSFDAAESFMADHQEVEAGGSCTIFSRVDLFVSAVHANSQNLYQDTPTIRHILY